MQMFALLAPGRVPELVWGVGSWLGARDGGEVGARAQKLPEKFPIGPSWIM